MLAAGTIRIGAARAVPDMLRGFSLDPDPILAEVGLSAALLDDPENVIPYAALGRLLKLCAARAACEHFGLLCGHRGGLASLGTVGFIAQHAPDVRSALTALTVHLGHQDRGAVVTFSVNGPVALLGYRVCQPDTQGAEQVLDGAMAVGLRLLQTLCGPDWRPLEVLIAHHRPADPRPYQEVFRVPVRFNAEESAIMFDSAWLDRPVAQAQPALQHLLLRLLDRPSVDFRDDVRRVLHTLIGHGDISQTAVARVFGLHPRTLHRRLGACGLTFRALADDVRHEVARQLLRDTTIALSQIAAMLAYTEASSFTRSFKRQSGLSPTAWRTWQKQAGQGAGLDAASCEARSQASCEARNQETGEARNQATGEAGSQATHEARGDATIREPLQPIP